MKLTDFDYELPKELIAKSPAQTRTSSRLLTLDGPSGLLADKSFPDLLDQLEQGDLMVFNNTRVIPARVFGAKTSGGKIEMLVERVVSATRVTAHVRASKAPKPGSQLILDGEVEVTVSARDADLFVIDFPADQPAIDVLERIGHMPLPPYIDRPDNDDDKERYQTVYNKHKGAVAAPTAGLHFDDAMLAKIRDKGINLAFVTLHVGAGTFQPVRVENVAEHVMHAEYTVVDQAVCDAVQQAKAAGKRVIAVGTTSVRSLETAAAQSRAAHSANVIEPFEGDTQIFIYPGFEFNVVDGLLTNFHLPQSTLMMLISAFAGYRSVMSAYQHAVSQAYRFFSYGDAMFITKNPEAALQGPHSEISSER